MNYEMTQAEIRRAKRSTKIARALRKRKKARAARDWY
jgi:hypothetical protein